MPVFKVYNAPMIENVIKIKDPASHRPRGYEEGPKYGPVRFILDAVILAIIADAVLIYGPTVLAYLLTLNPVGLVIGAVLLAMGIGLRGGARYR